jgi:hypothetical protein
MKLPPVGWAFFGLAVIVVAGYLLSRGILISSDIRPETRHMSDGSFEDKYSVYCSYLHFGGVREVSGWSYETNDEATNEICSMFDSQGG